MPNKLTIKNFIKKAESIHGKSVYDYSLIEEKDLVYRNKIVIKCLKHGDFVQMVGNHLHPKKYGCFKCGNEKISKKKFSSAEKFIKKAELIHGKNTYDYSKIVYKGVFENIEIICHKHGSFWQTPSNHTHKTKKHGCPKCSKVKKMTTKTFIEKANKVHCNKYKYPEDYINNKTKIKINCLKHGLFLQRPKDHLKGQGCPKCAGIEKITLKNFIERSNLIHDFKYDYSFIKEAEIKNTKSYVPICCPQHGLFKQKITHHLSKHGCRNCFYGITTSKNQKNLFNEIKTLHPKTILEHNIKTNGKQYSADIFIPEINAIIEYFGDYWHCNPKFYNSNYYHKRKKMHACEIWEYDKQRKQKLEKLGYKIIVVWENDFKKNKEKIIQNIVKLIL